MCKYDKEEQINGMASDKDFSIPNMSTAIMEGCPTSAISEKKED